MMKKTVKGIIAMLLIVATIVCASLPAYAARAEEYLADLRIIYASDYDEAMDILADSEFSEYYILDENLNEGTGEIGVWLAYKTTTDIEEAITDIAMMQEEGGYSLGNYQAMLAESKAEYDAMAAIYDEALQYFRFAYDEGDYLASAAYRQLNFYNVRTVGITDLPPFEGERLGDLFYNGIGTSDLATMFMEGNTYALDNVRSLLAMGVSYNEDGKHYLAKVGDSAAAMNANPNVFDKKNYKELAQQIASTILVYKNAFTELAAYESELNYEDEEFTELELQYAESKSLADRMRDVEYLGGKTLYDFCMEYSENTEDYSMLYPLVDALNEGQVAMTKVCHYYDVVRYSMSESPEEYLDTEISKLEEQYANSPIDVFLGVDRAIFKESFAITSAASRADAYTGSTSLGEALFGNGAWVSTSIQLAAGGIGVGLAVWAIGRCVKGSAKTAAEAARDALTAGDTLQIQAKAAADNLMVTAKHAERIESMREIFLSRYESAEEAVSHALSDNTYWNSLDYCGKIDALKSFELSYPPEIEKLNDMRAAYDNAFTQATEELPDKAYNAALRNSRIFTGVLYLLSIAALTYSAITLYNKIYDHYHPKYDEVPTAMVDLVQTPDGDRYIKYDVVYEAQTRNSTLHAGDLNAYKGERWNALYYTKNSEAGNPLLADFTVSNNNNRPENGYSAVHRFGEAICYDMNKYSFSSSAAVVFMSVAQSDKQKSDVTGVPDVVGSIFGDGFWFIAGTVGVALGVGGTLGAQLLLNKKKKENGNDTASAEN